MLVQPALAVSSPDLRTSRQPPARRRFRPGLHQPGRLVVAGFAVGVVVGTLLLALPIARSGPGGASLLAALFTATSALCVTGLAIVDTPTYWSGFGQVVILGLIQVGGFGIMALASLLGLLISRRLGLGSRLLAATETKAVGLGDVRTVLFGVARISLVVEAVTALVLAGRFALTYDETLPRSLWLGVFHAVSAFNNAGFALFSDSLTGFVDDPWISLPICAAVILGGLGFPVILELLRERRTRRWSVHTKLTLVMTAILLVGGTVFMTVAEWANPATLGALEPPGRLLAGFVQGVMPRTAGFNSVDPGAMNTGTLLGTDILMFIGGGSAGTAGGIKVGTFAVLLLAILAELRGDPDADLFDRRLSHATIRQALSVALLSVAAVVVPTLVIAITTTTLTLDQILYEVVSAFATVGLSTGITADLAPWHQLILVGLMFAGRLGPVTLASALVLREHRRLYRRPEGRPLIG
ncbi:TrkH family potassium uptake protein [uncultured Cellulomonas sp.]|uniref:TrkH family potassium uptake protein n=1 Tax=uncultured Cellulomonas sp. TaxID=189682 RepID=UPI002603F4E0|nr:potassium transporter TrkG [uncultured Cellulomonas sp.]